MERRRDVLGSLILPDFVRFVLKLVGGNFWFWEGFREGSVRFQIWSWRYVNSLLSPRHSLRMPEWHFGFGIYKRCWLILVDMLFLFFVYKPKSTTIRQQFRSLQSATRNSHEANSSKWIWVGIWVGICVGSWVRSWVGELFDWESGSRIVSTRFRREPWLSVYRAHASRFVTIGAPT